MPNLSNKTTQIGGTGSMRRRVKKRSKMNKIDNDERNLKKKIDKINQKILKLNIMNYNKLRDFIDELIKDYMKDLKREDIDKKNGLKYRDINEMGSAFIYKNFFYAVDEIKMLFRSDIYKFMANNFKISGKRLFLNFINSIDKILVNKEYSVNLDDEKYDPMIFTKALNFFKISDENKVHFKDIREQYEIQINRTDINQEEKDNINKYYLILRNQYKEYLKSF